MLGCRASSRPKVVGSNSRRCNRPAAATQDNAAVFCFDRAADAAKATLALIAKLLPPGIADKRASLVVKSAATALLPDNSIPDKDAGTLMSLRPVIGLVRLLRASNWSVELTLLSRLMS